MTLSAAARFALLVYAGAVASLACATGDRQARPTSSPTWVATATATPQPDVDATNTAYLRPRARFTLTGPLDEAEALAQPPPFGSWAVFEPEGRRWYVLAPRPAASAPYAWNTPTAEQQAATALRVRWSGDDTLFVFDGLEGFGVWLNGPIVDSSGPDCFDCVDPARWTRDRVWEARQKLEVGPAGQPARYRLTDGMSPVWSPRGHVLAFIADVCSGESLALFDADGGELRRLELPPDAGSAFAFAWSPDGTSLAVVSTGKRGYAEPVLSVVNADTGAAADLVSVRGLAWTQPSWSPDGARLLVGPSAGPPVCDFEGAVPKTELIVLDP